MGKIWSIISKSYHSNFNSPALKDLSCKFKEMQTTHEQKIAIQLVTWVSLDDPNRDESVEVFLAGSGKI